MNQRFFVIHAQKRAAKVRIVLFKLAFLRYNTTSRLSNLRFCPSTNGHTDEKKTMERESSIWCITWPFLLTVANSTGNSCTNLIRCDVELDR